MTQLLTGSVDKFITSLREKADCCEFGETADENIRDQVIETRKASDFQRSSNDCKSHENQRQTGRHYGKLQPGKTRAGCYQLLSKVNKREDVLGATPLVICKMIRSVLLGTRNA